MPETPLHIACFLPSLGAGGAERMTLQLMGELSLRGHRLDLVVAQARGPLAAEVPPEVRLVDLNQSRVRRSVIGLARYLRSERPQVLLSRIYHANLAAIIAVAWAGTATPTVVVEASHLSAQVTSGQLGRIGLRTLATAYRRAAAIVGVSQGVSDDLVATLRLAPGSVHTIYNPVVDAHLLARAALPSPHIWFADRSRPTLVAVGRLAPEKDYATLFRAMARLKQRQPARLVLFGEGPERARLETLVRELDLRKDVALPGYCTHPQAAMSRAAGFVLTSRYEGCPNALIEALACGCPVVATHCPSGPEEILAGGRWGELVPVGDDARLSEALGRMLVSPPVRAQLAIRGAAFSAKASADAYLSLIRRIVEGTGSPRKAA